VIPPESLIKEPEPFEEAETHLIETENEG